MIRIAYLGASGSFTEEAALLHSARMGKDADLWGASDPSAVLDFLTSGACDWAVLPVANTSGGLVWPTLAALGPRRLELLAEVELPVRFALFARPSGVGMDSIERVASHPQAFRQCARTLARILPGRVSVPWSDTASAARDLAAGVLEPHTAVLASLRAGEHYGLSLLATDVQDEPDNRTFFAVLGRVCDSAVQ